ncbi:Fic family protein [Thauera mechernichensis]
MPARRPYDPCRPAEGAFLRHGIVAAFAARHRLTWIHPFPDGNGRVARIALDSI